MKKLALLLPLVLAPAACQDDIRSSVQVQAVCAPTDDCTFAETCGAQFIGFPTLDVSLATTVTGPKTDTVWVFLQVANGALNNADENVGRTNTNDAHIDEIVIDYEGISIPSSFQMVNFLVPAGGTSVVSALTIPHGLFTTLRAYATPSGRQMTALLTLRGYFDSGSRFETGDFPIAINVCNGCVNGGVNGAPVVAICGGGPICPPDSQGQLPVSCPQ